MTPFRGAELMLPSCGHAPWPIGVSECQRSLPLELGPSHVRQMGNYLQQPLTEQEVRSDVRDLSGVPGGMYASGCYSRPVGQQLPLSR